MSEKQILVFTQFLINALPTEIHLGDCIGADEQAYDIAKASGVFTVGHPPINDSKRAFKRYDREFIAKDYLTRNADIVAECDILIVCPKSFKEQKRSGTWSTYRYAKKLSKQTLIIFPDGSFE